ncbi:hypothetical protein HYC85_024015 [Camellia sinensis]|uniref:NB-ARC domain-containing protein n=1 Tax=Camellia sinensis TaxID=4442 RepID=A0A7J7GK05_CAMSI|nr:hypothetical protein HYC85_024015 [Camellia sinensis]
MLIVLTDEDKNMSNEMLGEMLYKKLKGKRYLIVDLKMYLPNDKNGSRIMFTSRPMHASPDSHTHCLRFLTEEESWELFQRKVFPDESFPPKLIETGKQIMNKCQGLPLAIIDFLQRIRRQKSSGNKLPKVLVHALLEHFQKTKKFGCRAGPGVTRLRRSPRAPNFE